MSLDSNGEEHELEAIHKRADYGGNRPLERHPQEDE